MKSNDKKILFVIGSLQLGGAETQLSILATELVRRGWRGHLFSLEEHGPLRETFETAGVRVHVGGYDSSAPRWKKVFLIGRAQWRLYQISNKLRPQVLHAFLPLTNFMGALAGRMAGVGTIVTSRRALGTHQDRHPWWHWFDYVANWCSTVITANSQAVIEDTIRRDRVATGKLRLIYNGLNFHGAGVFSERRQSVREALGLLEEHIALVFVANLIPYKGHCELIEAFAVVYRDRPQLRLFLVGEDRGIGGDLKALSERLQVESAVRMLGRRNDVSNLLCGMDVGVMASHEEGCSNALLEKLAAGLPVVATRVGGNSEVLEGMPGCVLSAPKNSTCLANAVDSILGKECLPSPAAQVRINRIKERFSVEAMIDAHEDLYGLLPLKNSSRAD